MEDDAQYIFLDTKTLNSVSCLHCTIVECRKFKGIFDGSFFRFRTHY